MRKTGKKLLWLFLAAIVASSLSLSISGCKRPEPELIPIGDVRVIQKLESGNFEVTAAFVLKLLELAKEVRQLELELEKCREKK